VVFIAIQLILFKPMHALPSMKLLL